MNNQKRMVAALRTFVEKVFLPGVKRGDPQLNEWNKINQYFNSDYIPYEELMQYVESINLHPASHGSVTSFEKRELPPAFKKRNEEALHSNGQSGAFNPSKTFGGERTRMMFLKQEADDFGDKAQHGFGKGEEKGARNFNFPSHTILPGLEKMCKMMTQNHQRIQNMLGAEYSLGSPVKST